MKCSFVIASRNDGFCGDPMGRLRLVLSQLLRVAGDCEIVVTDWGSEHSISQAMRDLPQTGRIRFLYVDRKIAGEKFLEVLALNTAVRRARGTFIVRLDQDTLIGESFVRWAAALPDDHACAYFSLRRDLAPNQICPSADAPVLFPDVPFYFMGAVGGLIAPAWMWRRARGYCERLQLRNHMEHDLCLRFRLLGGFENLGPIVNYDFYHLWHERDDNLPSNRLRNPYEICQAIMAGEYWNQQDWGLRDSDEHGVTESVW